MSDVDVRLLSNKKNVVCLARPNIFFLLGITVNTKTVSLRF